MWTPLRRPRRLTIASFNQIRDPFDNLRGERGGIEVLERGRPFSTCQKKGDRQRSVARKKRSTGEKSFMVTYQSEKEGASASAQGKIKMRGTAVFKATPSFGRPKTKKKKKGGRGGGWREVHVMIGGRGDLCSSDKRRGGGEEGKD